MDSVVFQYDSVLSDVHMLQPRTNRLMRRLNRAGQPVFVSKFRILSHDQDQDQDQTEESESSEEGGTGEALETVGAPEENQSPLLDEDGDLELTRPQRFSESDCGREEVCPVLLSQTDPQEPEEPEDPEDPQDPGEDSCQSAQVIRIEHTMATLLEDVGKQVWRGALLLADFVLAGPGVFKGATVLELGAGTGLSSIITASVAKRVYCSDVGEDVLSMCRTNVSLNKDLMERSGGEVLVRKLDWTERDLCTDPEQEFSWSEEEVCDLYDHTTLILAADVVYDDDLTDAFFRTVYQLCSGFTHSCDVYISIEKRLNFTLRQMDVCCEAYQHFHHCLQQLQDLQGPHRFSAQKLAPSFKQSLMYERVDQLELWKVSSSYTADDQEKSIIP
ncbi:unnamed protein product [Knipowitschia caucasica]